METTLLWNKDIPTTAAKIIFIRGVSYYCTNCKRLIEEPYKGDCKNNPYHYWLRCPYCNATVDVTFQAKEK